jgi:hypothetical protein
MERTILVVRENKLFVFLDKNQFPGNYILRMNLSSISVLHLGFFTGVKELSNNLLEKPSDD